MKLRFKEPRQKKPDQHLAAVHKKVLTIFLAGSGLVDPGSHYVHEGNTLLSHQQLRGRLVGGEVRRKQDSYNIYIYFCFAYSSVKQKNL